MSRQPALQDMAGEFGGQIATQDQPQASSQSLQDMAGEFGGHAAVASQPQPSFMDKVYQAGGSLLGLPGRLLAGAEGLTSEISSDPKKAVKDYYQGARGEIQNKLLPEIQKKLGPVSNAFAIPQSTPGKTEIPSGVLGLSGSPQIPKFNVQDPSSYAGAAGQLTSQILPGEKVASAAESVSKPLLESLSKSLGGGVASKIAKAAAPLATKAVGGAASSPLFDTDAQTGAIANTLFGIPHALATGARNIASKALLPGAINSNLADLANHASELENTHGAQIATDEYKKYVGGRGPDGEIDPHNPGTLNQAWVDAKDSAAKVDQSGAKYDTASYYKDLNKGKQDLIDKYGNNDEAVSAVNKIMGDQIKKTQGVSTITGIKPKISSITDAINERQKNNAAYQNVKNVGVDSTQAEKAARDAHNSIRSALIKSFDKTIADNSGVPGMKDFSSQYAQANKMTQDVKNNFESVPSANQKTPNTTKFINAIQSKHPSANPSNFYQDFMPAKTNEGTEKFDQLKFMLGNDDAAKEHAKKIITSNLFKDSVDGDTINPSKMYNKYKPLSQSQKDYLFTPEEQHTLNLLKHSKKMKSTNLSGIGKAAMIPIHIVNLLTSAYGGFEGNELGSTFGHRLLDNEIRKRMGVDSKKGLTGKIVAPITRGLLMTNTQQDQQGAQ